VLLYLKGIYSVYLPWLVLYYILVFKIKGKEYETTFENVMQNSRKIKQFCYQFGDKLAPFVFIGIHICFMTICFIVSIAFFFNFFLNTLWLLFIITWAAYNGASYYIDVFSRKYDKNILEMDEMTRKVEEAMKRK
jgi:hypothetical protein